MASVATSASYGLRCANGSVGTGNPAREASSENAVFRGVVANVQTFGLKVAAHVSGMLPAPAAPAPQRAGVRDRSAFVSSIPFTCPDAVRRNQMDNLNAGLPTCGPHTWPANNSHALMHSAIFKIIVPLHNKLKLTSINLSYGNEPPSQNRDVLAASISSAEQVEIADVHPLVVPRTLSSNARDARNSDVLNMDRTSVVEVYPSNFHFLSNLLNLMRSVCVNLIKKIEYYLNFNYKNNPKESNIISFDLVGMAHSNLYYINFQNSHYLKYIKMSQV